MTHIFGSLRIWAEIEESEPFITLSNLNLEEDDEEAIEGEDNQDVPLELSTLLIVTEVGGRNLPTGYKAVRDEIVYDEA